MHQRVLYVDIDIHHGDGVEEAFYTTDRVMTVSFHKFGEYFPGTGDITDVGLRDGKNYSLNIPLQNGIDDESYRLIFEPIITMVIEWYRPGAIVLQCGADSLAGDRLGCFNLSSYGHGACVQYIKKFGIPMVLLGGGGYTIKNVARAWTYETSIALDIDIIEKDISNTTSAHYFGPEFKLLIEKSNTTNKNTKRYLDSLKFRVVEILRNLPFAPSVPLQYKDLDLSTPELEGLELSSDEEKSEKFIKPLNPIITAEFEIEQQVKRTKRKYKKRTPTIINNTNGKDIIFDKKNPLLNAAKSLLNRNDSDTETASDSVFNSTRKKQ